jgi:hypothetical protein
MHFSSPCVLHVSSTSFYVAKISKTVNISNYSVYSDYRSFVSYPDRVCVGFLMLLYESAAAALYQSQIIIY